MPSSTADLGVGQRIAGTLEDVSDEAIAVLARAVEVEPAAIELQLTLGALFRKRGEIDRAIHLHESIARLADLSPLQRARAELALAEDFLKAGVMDRAESLAVTLIDRGEMTGEALALLLNLHEQARDWAQAIMTAQRFEAVMGVSASARIAQYQCEIADLARQGGDWAGAVEAAERALSSDHDCVRASIILGAIAEARDAPAEAFGFYRKVLEQNPAFIGEVLDRARDCCARAQQPQPFAEFLQDAESVPGIAAEISTIKARWLADNGEDAAAFMAEELKHRSSERGLLLWLELSGAVAEDRPPEWKPIRDQLLKKLAGRPRYRCVRCGLTPSALFWQCPSCKHWGSILPS